MTMEHFASLFDGAGDDVEAEGRERIHTMASQAATSTCWPFLALSASLPEFEDRLGLIADRLVSIASEHGVSYEEIAAPLREGFKAVLEAKEEAGLDPKASASGLQCADCGHSNQPHAAGGPCACGCVAFNPRGKRSSLETQASGRMDDQNDWETAHNGNPASRKGQDGLYYSYDGEPYSDECSNGYGVGCDGSGCRCPCHGPNSPMFKTHDDVAKWHGLGEPWDPNKPQQDPLTGEFDHYGARKQADKCGTCGEQIVFNDPGPYDKRQSTYSHMGVNDKTRDHEALPEDFHEGSVKTAAPWEWKPAMGDSMGRGQFHLAEWSPECQPGGSGVCDGYKDNGGECGCSCHGAFSLPQTYEGVKAWHDDLHKKYSSLKTASDEEDPNDRYWCSHCDGSGGTFGLGLPGDNGPRGYQQCPHCEGSGALHRKRKADSDGGYSYHDFDFSPAKRHTSAFDNRIAAIHQALAEGQDPLTWLEGDGPGPVPTHHDTVQSFEGTNPVALDQALAEGGGAAQPENPGGHSVAPVVAANQAGERWANGESPASVLAYDDSGSCRECGQSGSHHQVCSRADVKKTEPKKAAREPDPFG